MALQDGLAGPAQRAACGVLRLTPPGGLLGLPQELTFALILRHLQVRRVEGTAFSVRGDARLPSPGLWHSIVCGGDGCCLRRRAWCIPAQAKELARLTCACVALRHLGGDNRLWEPLFHREFPHASLAARQAAAQRGFQAAFDLAWRVRATGVGRGQRSWGENKRRDEMSGSPPLAHDRCRPALCLPVSSSSQARVEMERARRREAAQRLAMMRTPPYFPLPTPGQPFMPPPPLGYPRHIIGGDYDRFPMLPGGGGMGGVHMGGGEACFSCLLA